MQDTSFDRPHVVILGAGVRLAAFPHGDRNGRTLPLMRNLVETVGLEPLLNKYGVSYGGEDFEALYSRLASSDGDAEVLRKIEEAVQSYFSPMELPDEVTLYDHLVLSLRAKDLIASFNWDPLLVQA
ncbi:MAG: hypothetical protein NTU88_09145, partial [Armatimonadetes bacterium]|nr:hypothetical protein [Armatimonadota bacterium]